MWIIVLLQWLLASDALQSVIGVEMNFWRSANDVSLFLLPRPGRCAQRQRPSVIRFTMTWKVSRDTCEEARPNRPRKQMRNKNIAIHFLKICSYLIVHVSGDNNFLLWQSDASPATCMRCLCFSFVSLTHRRFWYPFHFLHTDECSSHRNNLHSLRIVWWFVSIFHSGKSTWW